MNEDKIVEILEGQEIDDDKIAQIVIQLKEDSKTEVSENVISTDIELQIENEKDPLKKAALVAREISKSFEE